MFPNVPYCRLTVRFRTSHEPGFPSYGISGGPDEVVHRPTGGVLLSVVMGSSS
jgi:hypothetical protein